MPLKPNLIKEVYPREDDVPYLSHFRESFSNVFVAFNPFIQLSEFPTRPVDGWISSEIETAAKQAGNSCGVLWGDVAKLCDFKSVPHVNRALRLTGSKRIMSELADKTEAEVLLQVCAVKGLLYPDEGCFSPLLELSLHQFLQQLGQVTVLTARHFDDDGERMAVAKLSEPCTQFGPQIYASDASVYVTTYIDYHYALICQTSDSFAAADPSNFFEGFHANESTSDYWGIGQLN